MLYTGPDLLIPIDFGLRYFNVIGDQR